jgi:GNAT superfamily N-acetyltransferase
MPVSDIFPNGFRFTDDPVDPATYLKLLEDCFHVRISEAWFHWYHFQAPWGKSRIYTAWMKDRLASTVTFLPLHLLCGSEERSGSIYVNAMTHPDFQKMGLNVALLEMAKMDAKKQNEAYSITFPTMVRPSMKGMLRTGWHHHEDLFYWELSRIPKEGALFATQVPLLDASSQPLLDKFNRSIRLGVAKSVEFLNWRTARRPDIKYELYQYGLRDEILGILILKHYHTATERKTHIMEIIADDNYSLELLLQMAEARAATAGSQRLNLWVSDHAFYRSQMTRYGFVPSAEKNMLVTLTYEDGLILDSSPQDHFALLDNDVY